MGDIDTTVELGGFLEYEWEPFTLSFEMRQAVSGHDGFVGRAAVEYAVEFNPLGGILILLIEPELRFAGGTFAQSYFGVTPAQSLNTGYAPYAPDGGIYSYGVGLTAILPLSRNLFAALLLNADALAGDSRNSPFVRGPGSADQTSVGFLLAYQFGG
jgi:outer membrane protein